MAPGKGWGGQRGDVLRCCLYSAGISQGARVPSTAPLYSCLLPIPTPSLSSANLWGMG